MVYEWRDAPRADFAVIGDPVSHSLSPRMHSAAYKANSLSYQYVAVRVEQGEVPPALDHLQHLGYLGVNVTVPHKESAYNWAQNRDVTSETLGVCNTLDLRTRQGINTDAAGFTRSLQGVQLADGVALVMGAGGSAKAVVYALCEAGWDVLIWNRTKARAEEMIKQIGVSATVVEAPVLERVSLLVNTTSASLQGEPLPVEELWGTSDRELLLVDIAYGVEPTRLMNSAAKSGFTSVDGRRMLMEQGALAFEFWLGTEAPRSVMLEAIQPQ